MRPAAGVDIFPIGNNCAPEGRAISDLAFGAFDHLDRSDVAPAQFFRERLRIVEAYEEYGFYGYHVAEHHSTPLGLTPSPGIYLYHPLRLAEEVVMLDQLSNGRYDVGVGRGISPIEVRLYGGDPATSQEVFDEALEVMKLAWTQETVTFAGKHFRFDAVPVVTHPVQKPYPPLWYGVGTASGAANWLERGFHGITMSTRASVKDVWRSPAARNAVAGRAAMQGVARYIVVDKDPQKALALARRAYRVWEPSFHYLWKLYGLTPVFGIRPSEFDGMMDLGIGVAGSPEQVTEALQEHIDETGSNYLVGQFVFGDTSLAESLASIELFAREVMPALRRQPVQAS